MGDALVTIERAPSALGVSLPVRVRVVQGDVHHVLRIPEAGRAEVRVRSGDLTRVHVHRWPATTWRDRVLDGDQVLIARAPMARFLLTGSEVRISHTRQGEPVTDVVGPVPGPPSVLALVALALAAGVAIAVLADLVAGAPVGRHTITPLVQVAALLGIAALLQLWSDRRQAEADPSTSVLGTAVRPLWRTWWPVMSGLTTAALVGSVFPPLVDDLWSRVVQLLGIGVVAGMAIAVVGTVLQRRQVARRRSA